MKEKYGSGLKPIWFIIKTIFLSLYTAFMSALLLITSPVWILPYNLWKEDKQ